MTTINEIPLQQGTPQTVQANLNGVTYGLTFQYRNDLGGMGGWVLDLDDAFGNPLIEGMPLVTGANLLEQYGYLISGFGLWVQTTSDPDAVPTFDSLGDDGLIYVVTA